MNTKNVIAWAIIVTVRFMTFPRGKKLRRG